MILKNFEENLLYKPLLKKFDTTTAIRIVTKNLRFCVLKT